MIWRQAILIMPAGVSISNLANGVFPAKKLLIMPAKGAKLQGRQKGIIISRLQSIGERENRSRPQKHKNLNRWRKTG